MPSGSISGQSSERDIYKHTLGLVVDLMEPSVAEAPDDTGDLAIWGFCKLVAKAVTPEQMAELRREIDEPEFRSVDAG
jgi:hypothetical protein